MADEFDEPGSLESLKWTDVEHRLLLITPLEIKTDVPNLDGTGVRDVIFADVAVLDGPGAPDVHRGIPVYPRFLQGQIRANVGTGRSNLGRVGQDTSRQKRGQNAPWVLATPTEDDKRVARDYLAATRKQPKAAASQPAGAAGGSTTFSTEPPF